MTVMHALQKMGSYDCPTWTVAPANKLSDSVFSPVESTCYAEVTPCEFFSLNPMMVVIIRCTPSMHFYKTFQPANMNCFG